MIEKIAEWRGGIFLFLCLLIMFSMYFNRINELKTIEQNNRIAYYEK